MFNEEYMVLRISLFFNNGLFDKFILFRDKYEIFHHMLSAWNIISLKHHSCAEKAPNCIHNYMTSNTNLIKHKMNIRTYSCSLYVVELVKHEFS